MATNKPTFLSKMGNRASLVSLICGRESTSIKQIPLFPWRAESAELRHRTAWTSEEEESRRFQVRHRTGAGDRRENPDLKKGACQC